MTNSYSTEWFTTFLDPIPAEQTDREVAFVSRWLPRPEYTTVWDLCCGYGRHARGLHKLGYSVTGIDRSAEALAEARRLSDPDIRYVESDMWQLEQLPGVADCIVCLWQSFGYFDDPTNRDIVRQICSKLADKGRFILDIYHRGYAEGRLGTRQRSAGAVTVRDTATMLGDRLTVKLDYLETGGSDVFKWQLYTPSEIHQVAEGAGFVCLLACADFDEATPATDQRARMQLVFEKS